MNNKAISQDLSCEEYLDELLAELSDPVHKRLIQAYQGDDPVQSWNPSLERYSWRSCNVKTKNITIQGFRGFNEVRNIDFHDRLTVIYAPNSYGKSSISGAFEWLLYGVTSKVEKSDSKEEYKGSYRNRHLPESLNPFVKVTLVDDNGNETKFHGDITEDEIYPC